MLDEVYDSMKEAVEKAHQALGRDLAKLRTGRANLAILDGIRADYYGQPTPLNQMASISVPEPRQAATSWGLRPRAMQHPTRAPQQCWGQASTRDM